MKKNITSALTFIIVLLSCPVIWAQQACCSSKSAHNTFAMYSTDATFAINHELPKPFQYKGEGEPVTFRGMDGKTAYGFEIKSKIPTTKYLLVFHEFWGLNEYIKNESVRLHNELGDVNVLAVDLYDGKIAATREEATKFTQTIDSKRAIAIIEGAIQYAGKDARIATIGWCFGGTWSLQAALHADQQALGCVIYYGQPETDIERLSDLDCSVLGIFAEQDKWLNQKVVDQFKQNMKAAGKELTVHVFDADHAFANPSSERYKDKAAQQANAIALAYLQKCFASEK